MINQLVYLPRVDCKNLYNYIIFIFICLLVNVFHEVLKTLYFFIAIQNKGDNTITSENSEVVTELYYANFNDALDDSSLEGALKEFYQDFKYPLYKEKKVPQDAEVYNITHSTGKNSISTFKMN